MKYMGSKNRIAKHILPIILKDRKEGQWYVEPFVGGANMIDKVTGKRLGSDSNGYVIDALCLIRDSIGSIPKNNTEFTECNYNTCRSSHVFTSGVIGYAGIAFSFGAKWFGGWSRGKNSKGGSRDYVAEQYRASIKQSPLLQGVVFNKGSYASIEIPNNSIVYCDPPYDGATNYKDKFNHVDFWQWCRDIVKDGSQVFISEYNAPDDFVCVWQKEIQSGLNTNSTKKGIEKLFVHESQANLKAG